MKRSIMSVLALLALAILVGGCAFLSTPTPPTFTPIPSTHTYTPIPPTLTSIPPTFTPEPTATPVVYNVEIYVADEEGNTIPEAKIIQGETIKFADSEGVWQQSGENSELSISVWSQGYLLQDYSSILQPGDNTIQISLAADPSGLQMADLSLDGYKLVFAEDFQDNISDCVIDGNGTVVIDETNPENYLLLVDLRNLDEHFSCSFGPANIENAIIEAEFRYVDIRYDDFKEDDYYNWQGYYIQFREGFDVEGYPLQVPWGPTLQINDFTEDEWKFPITMYQSIEENRWYTLTTKYDGQRVEVRMNDTLRFTFLNPPTMSSTEPASIGAFTQAHIQFDNIKMWIPNN